MSVAGATASLESGGNSSAANPNSNARGATQFIPSTWLSMIHKYRPDLWTGRTREEVLDLRYDLGLSLEMADRYAAENAEYLERHGVPATRLNLYAAHFFGPEQAVRVIANPGDPLRDTVNDSTWKANFQGRGEYSNMTNGEYVQRVQGNRLMNTGVDPEERPDLSQIPAVQPGQVSQDNIGDYFSLPGGPGQTSLANSGDIFETMRSRYGLGRDATQEEIVRTAHQAIAPSMRLSDFGKKVFGYNPVKIRGGGSDWYALLEQSISGLTMGLSNELSAAVAASVLAYQDGNDWSEHYASRRKYLLDRRASISEKLGSKATMADLGGTVVGTILTGGTLKAAGVGTRALTRSILAGGATGGVRGATLSQAEDLKSRAEDAVQGATVGVIASAAPYAAGPLVRGATAGVQRAVNTVGTPGEWAGYGLRKATDYTLSKSALADRAGRGTMGRAAQDFAQFVSRQTARKGGQETGTLIGKLTGLRNAATQGIATAGGVAGTGLSAAAPAASVLSNATALSLNVPQGPPQAGMPAPFEVPERPLTTPMGSMNHIVEPPMEEPANTRGRGVPMGALMALFDSPTFKETSYEDLAGVLGDALAGDDRKLKKLLRKKTKDKK